MKRPACFVTFCSLLIVSAGFSQTPAKDGWGPWRYTDFKVAGIEFRSKCVASLGTDSRWEYQFRSRHDTTTDFAEREEHGAEGSPRNEWDSPHAFTLKEGEISPVFETKLHGTCAEVHELEIEIMCDAEMGVYPNARCFQDANGEPIGFKAKPSDPRYQ